MSDWSSEVCSSDLPNSCPACGRAGWPKRMASSSELKTRPRRGHDSHHKVLRSITQCLLLKLQGNAGCSRLRTLDNSVSRSKGFTRKPEAPTCRLSTTACLSLCPVIMITGMLLNRSEEHTSELQSLMRNSHAVFCL